MSDSSSEEESPSYSEEEESESAEELESQRNGHKKHRHHAPKFGMKEANKEAVNIEVKAVVRDRDFEGMEAGRRHGHKKHRKQGDRFGSEEEMEESSDFE